MAIKHLERQIISDIKKSSILQEFQVVKLCSVAACSDIPDQ